jgi:phosphoribosylanthranilate isomerase
MTVRFKICCMESVDDVKLAVRYGASAVGLVSWMPSGAGVISEERIIELASHVPPGVSGFLLTSLQSAEEIIAQHRRCRTNTLQFCDRLENGAYPILRQALPGISLVQVIHVTGSDAVDEALAAAKVADALLLDSGNPSLKIKELGGTGRVHNWQISRRICELSPVPVYLAGGLTPDNVAEAVRTVAPFGVDVCNGVRTNGKLDEDKLARFVSALTSA